MLLKQFGRRIDVAFKRMGAYSTYKRFDNLGDLVRNSNQGKKLVEEDGKFYVVDGEKKEPAFIPPHYECSGCGIIKGKPGTKEFNTLGLLGGGSGTEDYCTICDTIIKQHYIIRS